LQFDVLLFSSESSSEKVTAATAGVSALSSTKTSLTADPLAILAKQLGGSKRNALLRWCQNRTATYTVTVLAKKATVNNKVFLCLEYGMRRQSSDHKPALTFSYL